MSVSSGELSWVMENSECLLDEAGVDLMVQRLAQDITQQCQDENPVVLCVMTGAAVAVGMLLPKLNFPLELDYIHATRYQGKTTGSELVWKQTPSTSIANRTVILIDDILDEGMTMESLKDYCVEHGAERCYTAVLVNKDIQKDKPIKADFVGYQAADRYLFGLGMDYKGYLRNSNSLYACPANLEDRLWQL